VDGQLLPARALYLQRQRLRRYLDLDRRLNRDAGLAEHEQESEDKRLHSSMVAPKD
jgi:hypothetical protein